MHVNGSSGRRFKFDQPVEDVSNVPEGTTFENAGDLRFSDLGPPPERAPTEAGAERRRQADAEAVWNAKCPSCGVQMVGTRDTLLAHECADE